MQDLITSKMARGYALLAECQNAPQAKKIVDMANAAKVYAKRQNLGKETIDVAHALMAESQRLLGDFLITAEKQHGARGIGKKVEFTNVTPLPKLEEAGITKRESSECQRIARVAKNKPELFEAYRSNEARISDFRREEKKQEHTKRVQQSKTSPPKANEIPGIILADPPWRYEHCESPGREIENHYNTATLDEIFKHSPNTLDDCILFMWATAPKLDESLQVMKSWGFTYRSCAVWDKQKIGMGYWFRIRHELLLVGIKGKPECTPESERISSIIQSPRGKHSQKPECVYEWIERAFPLIPKLEMYCRSPRKGWSVWGNEC